jgi:hypothetical protein
MRIPDDIEDLVLAFVEPGLKAELRWMSREQIDEFIVGNIQCVLEPGYVEKNSDPAAFPYKVTPKGREILLILSPCKRSGR